MPDISYDNITIVIPAKNESEGLQSFLPKLKSMCSGAEIILVDDGSTDNTRDIALSFDIRVITHPYSKGNGASIKTGAQSASREVLVFMDGDGQHRPEDIPTLLHKYNQGYALVVGARSKGDQASFGRAVGNWIYNGLASWMTEQKVLDLTSGMRVANRQKFLEFLHILPNGFSYPTTSTMAFYRAGYSVTFVPIKVNKRLGKSHLRPLKDGIKFLLIIFKVATLFSPLKIFFPLSLSLFMGGFGYYLYSYMAEGRFTNMGALLFTTSIVVFLIGLVSEQITILIYKK